MIRHLNLYSKLTLIAVSTLVLTACLDSNIPSELSDVVVDVPPPPPDGGLDVPPPVLGAPGEPIDVNDFAAGLCGDDTFDRQLVSSAIIRDCDSEHDFEVAGLIQSSEAEGAPFPGFLRLRDQARLDCQAIFEDYTGTAFIQSELDLDTITPNETTWLEGDRTIICLVVTVDGEPMTSRAGL